MDSALQGLVELDGIQLPPFLYGTAWKEEQTQGLTKMALEQGFRGIDTANQRKHYHEAAVGEAIQTAIIAGIVKRDDLFLQTKFTFQGGQDHRLPYDSHSPIPIQVEQSFASSLEHLKTDRIDSYVLHGPTRRVGLTSDDWAVWRAMEAIHDSGRVRLLGVSNVSLEQLQVLCNSARIPPCFVQNRCYAVQNWDHNVRDFCARHEMIYQGFSLLTANRDILVHPVMIQTAKRYSRTTSQIVFRFALDVGMLPLTGTTSAAHMQADLGVFDFQLTPEEIRQIEYLATS